ncbi:hypothetical protein IFM89_026079 [Coptis chinensis]|uniref:Uncharacterized protein n=1 Tax=Coptis chinensis TaxID=261450 RepID=A0A835HHH9_9MAGN|nr:hypothetical protein IFM89_026079 [Coptis chinensis]
MKMASPKGMFGSLDGSPDMAFPEDNINGELNPGATSNFPVDPVSSHIHTSKKLKEQVEAEDRRKREMEKKKKWKDNDDCHKKLKSTVLISGVVVAVVGALCALTKKLRERPSGS